MLRKIRARAVSYCLALNTSDRSTHILCDYLHTSDMHNNLDHLL